jgi:hypothetical protein
MTVAARDDGSNRPRYPVSAPLCPFTIELNAFAFQGVREWDIPGKNLSAEDACLFVG